MIDFLKFSLEMPVTDQLLENPCLNFTEPFNIDTGEVVKSNPNYHKRMARYGEFVIEIIKNEGTGKTAVYVRGSVHKQNSKGVNHTDFNLRQLDTALADLFYITGIDSDQARINSLEFGVNFTTPIPCSQVMNSIISYRGGIEYELRSFHGTGDLKRFSFTNYQIKVYNKSLYAHSKGHESFNLDNLLRFEIHVDRMRYLTEKGIILNKVADLFNPRNHEKMGQLLEGTFRNLIMLDTRIDMDQMSRDDKEVLDAGSNPRYWKEIYKLPSTKKAQRFLKKYRSIVVKHAPNDLQDILASLILAKWSVLTKGVHFSPTVQKWAVHFSPTSSVNSVHFSPPVQNPEVSTSHTHIVGENSSFLKDKVIKKKKLVLKKEELQAPYIPITEEIVKKSVVDHFGITLEAMLGLSKKDPNTWKARIICIMLLIRYISPNKSHVARMMNRKSHSAVIDFLATGEGHYSVQISFRNHYHAIESSLMSLAPPQVINNPERYRGSMAFA